VTEVQLLGEILQEIRLLRQAVERGQRSPIKPGDREALRRLLPAIGGALGDEHFLAAEIETHTSPAIQVARRNLNAKQLGRLFKRASGVSVEGFMVSAQSEESGAILWQVLKCS
jgi:hypothetical protein